MLWGLTGTGLAWEKFRKYVLETAMKWTALSISHISFMMLSQGNRFMLFSLSSRGYNGLHSPFHVKEVFQNNVYIF